MTTEDEWATWMRAAMAGDAVAYRSFLEAVTPHLRAMVGKYAFQFGAPSSDIEDIIQEVLLAIHLKRSTWDLTRPLSPWLSAIVRNKLIDALRRRGRRASVPLEDVAELIAAPEGRDHLQAYDLDRMINRLRGPQRDIVRAISMDGSSVQETASRLNMTEGAVRVALHRALRALAAAYRGNP